MHLDKLIEELGLDFDKRSKIEVIYDLRKKNKGEYISIPPTKEIPEEGFHWMSNDEWDASVPQKTYFFLY